MPQDDSGAPIDAASLLAAQPRYAAVATALASEILEGRRPVGTLLPSEQELCAQFGVSRSTVRQALRRLSDLGLVASAQGVGTRVIADQPRGKYVLAVRSATDVMGYEGPVRLDIRGRQRIVADAALANRLNCPAGTAFIHVQGVRRGAETGEAISVCDLYIASAFTEIAMSDELAATPAYRLIAQRHGIPVAAVHQDMGAIALDSAQAQALGVAAHAPGLFIRRQFLAQGGQLLEATTNIHASSEHFMYSLRLGGEA